VGHADCKAEAAGEIEAGDEVAAQAVAALILDRSPATL
jgi:hypothetical protein